MKYDVVLFDFDGVLCKDRFYVNPQYSRLLLEHPPTWEFIQNQIFQVSDIPDRWMRNQLTMDNINRFISNQTGIQFDLLSHILLESVAQMQLEQRLIKLAQQLRDKQVSIGIVTNNMDVFNKVTVPRLSDVFPVIVNSADYGLLKHEQGGKLFDVALKLLGVRLDYSQVLLIDDSISARSVFQTKGGETYEFTSYEVFEPWALSNLLN
jgi:FMN phosphatase YigB (HAD superfamily)